jgi:exopolysaccharide biosynthesis polyprenyl glycosylphosphotransferase
VKPRSHVYWQIAHCLDAIVLILSFIAAYQIRDFSRFTHSYGNLYSLNTYLWMLWVIVPTWLWLMHRYRLDRPIALDSPSSLLLRLSKVHILGTLVLLASVYLVDRFEISRLLTQLFLVISGVVLVIDKLGLRALLVWAESKPGLIERWRVLVVSSDSRTPEHLHLMRDHPNWSVEWIGPVPLQGTRFAMAVNDGGRTAPAAWNSLLRDRVIDEVVAVTPWHEASNTGELAAACVERGITFRHLVTLPPADVGRYSVEAVSSGAFVMSLETVPQGTLALAIKRLIDVAGGLVGVVICGVALAWYGLRIRRESPGPIFFRQERIGLNGRKFTLYKFRTMCVDAEVRLKSLRKLNHMRGMMFKMKDDPRVTPLGNVLRRRHIDELPQFWNVLKGQMSLVGTRPPTGDEVVRYRPHHYRRLSMKPGLTGLWQISGNGTVNDFEDVVALDCNYIDNWSLWLDLRILGKTLAKVLRADGW